MSDFLHRLAASTLDPSPAIVPSIGFSFAAPMYRGRVRDPASNGSELRNPIAASDPGSLRLTQPPQWVGNGLKELPAARASDARVETDTAQRVEETPDAPRPARVLNENQIAVHSIHGAYGSTQQQDMNSVIPEPFHEESAPPASGKALEATPGVRIRERVVVNLPDPETGTAGLRNTQVPAGESPGRGAPDMSTGKNDRGRSGSREIVGAGRRATEAAGDSPHTVTPVRSSLEPTVIQKVGPARPPVTGPGREVPPTIEVTIGRIDVRAVVPSAPPASPARRVARGPRLTLDDYLKQHRSQSSPR
jgi:hypothetical protein